MGKYVLQKSALFIIFVLEAVIMKKNRKTETCHHYWIIEAPNGRVSKGQCKLCGKTKTFLNYAPGEKGSASHIGVGKLCIRSGGKIEYVV